MTIATVSETLRRAGFAVTATTGVAEAVDHARRVPHALAIFDHSALASMGSEMGRRLHQVGVPFIVLSAHNGRESVQQAVEAGALGYFFKPIDPVQLVPAVDVALKRLREFSALVAEMKRLREAAESTKDIGVAVGLLMAHRGLPRRTAFETLRQQARRTRQRLAILAADVVDRVGQMYEMQASSPLDATGKRDDCSV